MNTSLSHDLITMDILTRLPFNSLVRFGSVSKSWDSLLRDSTFASYHMKHPSSSHNTDECVLFLESCRPCKPIKASFLFSTQTNEQTEDVSLPLFSDFATDSDCRMYGPCDGLVCLYIRDRNKDDKIYIWNPSTREIRDISNVPHDSIPESTNFGIGFDGKTKDYKVVCVACYPHNHTKVAVYSLNSDSWRDIDSTVPAAICRSPKSSAYVDGFYYWPTQVVEGEEGQPHTILSFDMTKEVFEIIHLPPDGVHGSKLDSVIVYNGSLAAISKSESWSYPINLWVMNKDNKSWLKWIKIDIYARVLGLCKRFLILEMPGHPDTMLASLVCAKKEELEYKEPNNNPSGVQALIYKGSLVSLSKKENN